ncbi:tyrosine-type recombinase/integrase [Amycolatopsis sp. NPDC047767]|uniref:tyrosine-type recombinase/integrase n=1 Tax=Amycolatopsis sp. NPDC047767 TaxID=3156765 RepID=UPI0034552616
MPAEQAELDAARLLLSKMGINPADLVSEPEQRKPIPTISEYLPAVQRAVSAATARAYSSYWRRLEEAWGSRRLDEPTPTEIKELAEAAKQQALVRRNSRGGRSAAENFIAAVRCLYRHAVNDEILRETENPARRVPKPRRLPSLRRALHEPLLVEINEVAATTGDDPGLDTLLLRLHTETACRRGGALGLRPRDLDETQCLVLLREKDGTSRLQPVSRTLMSQLLAHAEERGATHPDGPLLRYRTGEPITKRRYDHLWDRLGRHIPSIRTQNISTHWLRHTTLTWVERHFGYATAHAFAGHADASDSATITYIKADLTDIATALQILTSEPHPLARQALTEPAGVPVSLPGKVVRT